MYTRPVCFFLPVPLQACINIVEVAPYSTDQWSGFLPGEELWIWLCFWETIRSKRCWSKCKKQPSKKWHIVDSTVYRWPWFTMGAAVLPVTCNGSRSCRLLWAWSHRLRTLSPAKLWGSTINPFHVLPADRVQFFVQQCWTTLVGFPAMPVWPRKVVIAP